MTKIITQTDFKNLKLFHRGKVRDVYDLGEHLLIVATDRISAFDVIFNEGIPNKGKVLTQISNFWFEYSKDLIENHIITTNVKEYPQICKEYEIDLDGRSMLVKKTKPILIEAVVRGYLSGSGWNQYKIDNSVCEITLPNGLKESSKLPNTIFTPSTKAEIGKHDENISYEETVKIIGKENAEFIRDKSIEIYQNAAKFAFEKGIIIADTKMEFGIYKDNIILIDELLTPDSSRFWSKEKYVEGKSQPSYDKQFVRDYLISIGFNKQPPPPEIPQNVIDSTSKLYIEALKILSGKDLQ